MVKLSALFTLFGVATSAFAALPLNALERRVRVSITSQASQTTLMGKTSLMLEHREPQSPNSHFSNQTKLTPLSSTPNTTSQHP